jgi:CheY-like chemotaxis protein
MSKLRGGAHRPRLAATKRKTRRLALACMQALTSMASDGQRRRVLVIDDQPGVRAFVCAMVKHLGHDPAAAPDGRAALTLLPRQRYDLVITDLRMPGMSGWEVVERVRQQIPGIPVIVMSGFATDDDIARATRAGVCLLQKPFRRAELEQAIVQACSHQTHASPRVAMFCPVCQRPLSSGASLLPQGDRLVHAYCWSDVPTDCRAEVSQPSPGTGPRLAEGSV